MGDSDSKKFGDSFLNKLSGQLKQPAPVFGKSLFAGAGTGTKDAWDAGTSFATDINNGGGLTPEQRTAMGNVGGLATAYDPNSEAYKRLRQGVIDDTLKNVGSAFTASGRFGGGSYIDTASEGVGDALAGLDYGNMTADINNRYRSADSLFGMGQTALGNRQGAIGALGQVGAAQDADTQGALMGEADLFDRTNNGELDRLAKLGAIFGDPIGAANEAPWWQQALSFVAGNAGKAISGGAFK